jgi:hypothetical protein
MDYEFVELAEDEAAIAAIVAAITACCACISTSTDVAKLTIASSALPTNSWITYPIPKESAISFFHFSVLDSSSAEANSMIFCSSLSETLNIVRNHISG